MKSTNTNSDARIQSLLPSEIAQVSGGAGKSRPAPSTGRPGQRN